MKKLIKIRDKKLLNFLGRRGDWIPKVQSNLNLIETDSHSNEYLVEKFVLNVLACLLASIQPVFLNSFLPVFLPSFRERVL